MSRSVPSHVLAAVDGLIEKTQPSGGSYTLVPTSAQPEESSDMSEDLHAEWRIATRAIHVGQGPDPATGATVPPIHTTSTYTQESPE